MCLWLHVTVFKTIIYSSDISQYYIEATLLYYLKFFLWLGASMNFKSLTGRLLN